MSLLRVKAKVKQVSEDDMELMQGKDMGNFQPKSEAWVWKSFAIPVEDVYKLISYTSAKCIVVLYETGEEILVAEPFDTVFTRWNKLREESNMERPEKEQEEETEEPDQDED